MVKKGRIWTPLELETFCQILADPALNYAHTLETKALKKSANKEVFESTKSTFLEAIQDPSFKEENGSEEHPELDLSIPKLRNKYNNIKRKWRQRHHHHHHLGLLHYLFPKVDHQFLRLPSVSSFLKIVSSYRIARHFSCCPSFKRKRNQSIFWFNKTWDRIHSDQHSISV